MKNGDKLLPVSLEELEISKDLIRNNFHFNYEGTYNVFFIRGVSKHLLGFDLKLSDYFRNKADYNRFYKALSLKLGFTILHVKETDALSEITNNTFYIPEGMSVLDFYESIRNSFAHRNFVFENDENVIFFMSYSKNGSNIEQTWKSKCKFIFKCEDPDIMFKIGDFLYEYIAEINNKKQS